MRRKKRSIESLESRIVLSAAPVLIRDVGDSSVMVATAETTRHQAIASHEPDESGYDDAQTKLVADFTGDGIDDVFVEWGNSEWGMRVNDGTQLFLMPWGNTPSVDSEIIDTADFNNDGLEDVLSYDRVTGDVWVSLNSISGGFTNERWSKFTPKTEWTAILVNDFDGDGWVDVLGGESGGGWWLAKNTETTFNNHYWGKLGEFDWRDLVSEDFTGDGIADVAGRASDNTWWLWTGQQNSQKTNAEYFGHWKMNDDWFDVDAADFDGDGKADIIGRSDDGLLWVGMAGESRFETDLWGKGWIHSAEWTNMSIVDMNGDELPDLVGKAKDGTWWYATSDGERFRNHYWQKSNVNTGFVSTNFLRDDPADLATPLTGNEPSVSATDTSPVNQEVSNRTIYQRIIDGSRNTVISTASNTNTTPPVPPTPEPVIPIPADPLSADTLPSSPVKLTVNEAGILVVTASGVETRGLDFRSASGSLIPSVRGPAPFSLFLSNTPNQITFGNLGSFYRLDGSLTLDIGWDSSGPADLRADFGDRAIPIPIDVDDALDGGTLRYVSNHVWP